MKFIKTESYGNDFVLLTPECGISSPPTLIAKAVCDRHFGIGADGMILLEGSDKCDYRMRIFNPDGSEAEMCGNALRISALVMYVNEPGNKKAYSVETKGGIKHAMICESGDIVTNIGSPVFECEAIPVLSPHPIIYRPFHGLFSTCMSFGNPHLAVEVNDLSELDMEKLGKAFEKDKIFPNGTNVHFYTVTDEHNIEMRPWERVCGETLGCSTGSAAVSIAANISGKCENEVYVHQKGGTIKVTLTDDGLLVTGKAKIVFEGEWRNEDIGTV